MEFHVRDRNSAPVEARESLREVEKAFGFVPNLMGVMASAPPLLRAYRSLNQQFEQTSFSPVERQVVALAVSHANRCTYCMAAHTVTA